MSNKFRTKIKEMYGGKCAYCGCQLGERWHIDHVKPVVRKPDIKISRDTLKYKIVQTNVFCNPENNNHENLVPACVKCNIHKGARTPEQFRLLLQDHVLMLNKSNNYSIYQHAKRFGLVNETDKPIVFFYETFEKERAGGGV